MASRAFQYFKAAFTTPANLLALGAGTIASMVVNDPVPLLAAMGASGTYLVLMSTSKGFRRAIRASTVNDEANESTEAAFQKQLDALAASQREHYQQLETLRDQVLERYRELPGGRVLAASSQPRLDALLGSFVRLIGTLNTYRKYLSSADRQSLEAELAGLKQEIAVETNERLKEVKQRRAEILAERVARFAQAQESREVVSHQLASIEDLLKLTHERSIAIRDPEVVAHQLEALTSEVAATEETVREMERFMEFSDELHGGPSRERVR